MRRCRGESVNKFPGSSAPVYQDNNAGVLTRTDGPQYYNNVCYSNVPRRVCETVPRENCQQEPVETCSQVPRQECRPVERLVEREECEEVPSQQCRS